MKIITFICLSLVLLGCKKPKEPEVVVSPLPPVSSPEKENPKFADESQFPHKSGTIIVHFGRFERPNFVSVVLNENKSWVYYAAPPKVQKTELKDYFEIVPKLYRSKKEIEFIETGSYTEDQIKLMIEHANSLIGKPYGFLGRGENLNSSEFVAGVLSKSGQFNFPKTVSPSIFLDIDKFKNKN